MVVDAVSNLVRDVNIKCFATGSVSLQAMDSSLTVIAAFFLLPNVLPFLFKREANIDCSTTGDFSLQAMDSSHGHRRLPPPHQRPHLPLRKS
ncbi:hypothetical protein ACSQ67_017793 [Phaseolus vulgaris]